MNIVLYSQLTNKLNGNTLNLLEIKDVFIDLGDLVLNFDLILKKTLGSELYINICKIINVILLDFLIDSKALIKGRESKILEIIHSNKDLYDERQTYENFIESLLEIINTLFLISENDDTVSERVLFLHNKRVDDFNSALEYIRSIV